ncbi:hypothetical protein EYC80_004279 [Monilinia laxa]|uniref:Uncharacterized protein n=1 Tax=Monilinia laxa TaxID=61186 RepID=A0A5N6KM96_MONLA|nr:hypothetical protein EYC80_004279 [Monilinia laxa]
MDDAGCWVLNAWPHTWCLQNSASIEYMTWDFSHRVCFFLQLWNERTDDTIHALKVDEKKKKSLMLRLEWVAWLYLYL